MLRLVQQNESSFIAYWGNQWLIEWCHPFMAAKGFQILQGNIDGEQSINQRTLAKYERTINRIKQQYAYKHAGACGWCLAGSRGGRAYLCTRPSEGHTWAYEPHEPRLQDFENWLETEECEQLAKKLLDTLI